MRFIVIMLVVGLSVFKLFMGYRGLDHPTAMDQAQIARSVAQGKGFTTNFIRPMEMKNAARAARNKGVDFDNFTDTNHAPLNIAAMAVALKATGCDEFESTRMEEGGSYLYGPDRVISGTSIVFFIISMLLAYTLVARLFDETVACSTVIFLALSDLVLQYAVGGLPQPLMTCCFLAAMHFVVGAVRADERGDSLFRFVFLLSAYVCVTLMCLAGWMNIWCALGLIIFCAFRFRPFGAFSVPGFLILGVTLFLCTLDNKTFSGSEFGNAYYSFYNCLGGSEELILRTTNESNIPFDSSGFILRLLGHIFSQFSTMYVNMGSILVTPFFILALLNKFKKKEVESVKWATFAMWSFACIGMAMFGVNNPYDSSQLAVVFAPLFTAYGVSLVFNMLARLKLDSRTFTLARGLAIFLMLLVSAGPFLFKLPKDIYQGIWLSDRGRPNFPPYYPPALNVKLADMSNPRDLIMTDQPWAVAWYADRKAVWMPLYIDDYVTTMQPIIAKAGVDVQGFLITPSSHSPVGVPSGQKQTGITGVVSTMGDFAPLALEGKLLLMTPKRNLAFADLFTEAPNENRNIMPMGHIVSSKGQYSNRNFLLGTEIIYYSK